MQAGFATRFLRALRQWGIHTAIETAGDAAFSRVYPLAQACDEVLFDLKMMDPGQAREQLALNLPRVLENFSRLVENGVHVIPRVPLIPGFTLCERTSARFSPSWRRLRCLTFTCCRFTTMANRNTRCWARDGRWQRSERHRQQRLTDSLSWLNKLVFA